MGAERPRSLRGGLDDLSNFRKPRMAEDTDVTTAEPRHVGPTVRQIGAVAAGNALETYDFLTYSFFAKQIGETFFPSRNASDSLLLSLATFGAGFLTRPLGGLVIGAIADRAGRKPAMVLSFVLMGLAVTGMALTPSHAAIGASAGFIVLALRMIQGFALGGEIGASTTYLMEAAPQDRRGFYVSLQSATQNLAILAAGLVGLALSSWLAPAHLQAWGWRIAMLVGALTVPFGWLLRRDLAETLPAPDEAHGRSASISSAIIVGFGLLFGAATISFYVLGYLTTYAQTVLHMKPVASFINTAILGLTGGIMVMVSGGLSDRLGRKPVALAGFGLLLVLCIPAFMFISLQRTSGALFCATIGLAAMAALVNGAINILITESLPTYVRVRSLALVYAVSVSVFGGSAQFVVAWLLRVSKNPLAPAWYMTAAVAVGFITMIFMTESAPLRLRRRMAASAATASQA